jgi:excisionase family DNA binding protein
MNAADLTLTDLTLTDLTSRLFGTPRRVAEFTSQAVRGQLLTPKQLAQRWQVPTSHVYRLARAGEIPSVRLGKYVRFTPGGIAAFEAGQFTQGGVKWR